MTLCPCGRPTSAGRTMEDDSELCLICETEALFKKDILSPAESRKLRNQRWRAKHPNYEKKRRARKKPRAAWV